MKLLRRETLSVYLQIILIASAAKRGRHKIKKHKYIKLIFPNDYKTFWLEQLVEGALNQTEARGAVILLGGPSKLERPVSNHITAEFSKHVSSIKIDYPANRRKYFFLWKWQSLFATPQSTLFIFLFSEEKNQTLSVDKILECIALRLAPLRSTSPKILFIIIRKNVNFSRKLRALVFEILRTCWKQRRLIDMSFVIVFKNKKKSAVAMYHNEFKQFQTLVSLNKSRSTIFPYKLRDMGKANFDIHYRSTRPEVENMELLSYKLSRSIKSMSSITFVRHLFCQVHNCTAKVVRKKLVGYEAEIMRLTIYTKPIDYKVFHSICDIITIYAAIPHHKQPSTMRLYNLENIFIFFAFTSFLAAFVRRPIFMILQGRKNNWSVLNVLLCFLGYSLVTGTSRKARIAYLIIIVIFFWVSFDFSSTATTYETEIMEIKIQSMHDLYAMNVDFILWFH